MAQRLCAGILICFLFIDMLINKNSSVFLKGFTQLEKIVNNILAMKVGIFTKKLLYLKQKNLGIFLKGFTLIEALIVIAIIALLSVYYVANLRPDKLDSLRMDSTRLAADIRYIRNMAATRAVYNGSFPSGGYGILLKNGDGINIKSYYKLYAGTESNVLKTVYLADPAFRLVDSNSLLERSAAIQDQNQKKFAFVSENNISVNGLVLSPTGDYQIEIYYDFEENGQDYYYLAKLDLGRQTADDFIWSNIAVTYETDTPDCGNKIIESGEVCEPVDVAGNFNSNCTPQCQLNICGDGYILGSEQCELNQNNTRGLYCSINYWCKNCLTPGGNNTCISFDANGNAQTGASCCGALPVSDFRNYNCMNCVLVTNTCPSVCPDPGDIEG